MPIPTNWIDRHGTKHKISEMSDPYLVNVYHELEDRIANKVVPFSIMVYARMFNRGKKWPVEISTNWHKNRLRAIRKEMRSRGII